MLKKEGREGSFLSINAFSLEHPLLACSALLPNALIREGILS